MMFRGCRRTLSIEEEGDDMSRVTLYYVAAVAFIIAAIASAIGSQWVLCAAFAAVGAAFVPIAVREQRKSAPRRP
jgi:Flp pilus assembly protein TadB